MTGPPVYVFTAGEAGHYGRSLLRDGSNLPRQDAPQRWRLFQQITLADDDLLPFASDIHAARTHLMLRSYHLAHVSATILQFPKTHRSSA
jgi:hypothetical protein